MTFLGIGPGEFFLILIILLVVVGPERLPGFARQAGKMLVSLRNWIQRSPDAQLFLRARDELEGELRAIRDDLAQEVESVRMEMQTVREEMIQATREATIDATRQLDTATQAAEEALEAARKATEAAEEAAAVAQADLPAPAIPVPDAPALAAAPELAEEARTIAPPAHASANGQPLTVPRSGKPNAPAPAPAPEAVQAELTTLKDQLQQMSGELRALQEQIRAMQGGAPAPQAPHAEEVAS